MRILFLAPRLPYPPDTGGKIRTFNILKQIAKRAKVHLVCFSFDQSDLEFKDEFRKLNIEVTLVSMREPSSVQKAVNVLANPAPHSMVKYQSLEMRNTLIKLRQANTFDAVHVDHLHMAYYRDCLEGIPAVLDEHNVEYMILKRCADVERNLVKKLLYLNQAGKMKDWEMQQLKSFSRFLAVSEEDQSILDGLNRGRIKGETVPNGVDTEYFKRQGGLDVRAQEDALVFTGSMDWLPNEDAVMYFAKDILPLIWEKKPHIKFYVVGKGAKEGIMELGKQDARIVVTGRVDDVRPIMAKSKVFVVPIRVGGGTRLKILEAMAMQKAVVSTTIGAEGIKHSQDKDILLADTPQRFADGVLELLEDTDKNQTLGRAGRDLVCRLYDWNIIGQKLEHIYGEVINVK